MHRGINRSSLPAGAEDVHGALPGCHGANKYGPIDRRVREEEKRKEGSLRSDKCWPSGATRARRPHRTINMPRTVSRIIKE